MKIKLVKSGSPLNKRRRTRYKADPDYQEKERERARIAYRRKSRKETPSVLRSLNFLSNYTKRELVITPDGMEMEFPVASIGRVAAIVNKSHSTFLRWIEDGRVPEPVLEVSRTGVRVYHQEEIRALLESLGEHERDFDNYTARNTKTKERIQQRILFVRKQYKFGVR